MTVAVVQGLMSVDLMSNFLAGKANGICYTNKQKPLSDAYQINYSTNQPQVKYVLHVTHMLNKNSLAVKKVRGQSEATNISDQKL